MSRTDDIDLSEMTLTRIKLRTPRLLQVDRLLWAHDVAPWLRVY